MEQELKYFLEQGAHTVKDLVRLTGKTDSGIRKAIANMTGVVEGKNDAGHKTFALPPQSQPEKPQEDIQAPEAGPTTSEPTNVAPAQPEDESKGKRGRKASHAGKKLFPSDQLLTGDEPKTYTNPRRAGSHGYRSLQIIIDHAGISTENFVSEGGRLNDLRWDIEHGNVRAE